MRARLSLFRYTLKRNGRVHEQFYLQFKSTVTMEINYTRILQRRLEELDIRGL